MPNNIILYINHRVCQSMYSLMAIGINQVNAHAAERGHHLRMKTEPKSKVEELEGRFCTTSDFRHLASDFYFHGWDKGGNTVARINIRKDKTCIREAVYF
jgi:hypothetical protein